MQFNWRLFLAGFLALGGLASCEEDFDPNAEYQETAVIYSLLDSSQPVQYVKVTKAFLNTETNALLIAANHPDSSNFYHPITVELQKLKPSDSLTVLASYPLHEVPVTNKMDGTFSTSQQVVYATDSNAVVLGGNDLFKVVVTNTVTGKQYSSATRIVNAVCIDQIGYNPVEYPCDPNAPSEPLSPHSFQNLRFDLVPNAGIYKASYFLVYKEYKQGNEDLDTIEFIPVNNRFIKPTTPSFTEVIEPNRMYQQLANAIDISGDDINTYRTMEQCLVKVTAGGRELTKYVQVNNSYSAILQNRPEYSNIVNGAGLFSSRNTQTVRAHFSQDALDSLVINYPQLKFRN